MLDSCPDGSILPVVDSPQPPLQSQPMPSLSRNLCGLSFGARRASVREGRVMKKKCGKCKHWKALDTFHKERASRDGLGYWCRECQRRYQRRYRATEAGKAAMRRYRSTEPAKAAIRRYEASEVGKVAGKARKRRYRENNKEKIACRNALNNAIIAGKIIRPKICSACNQPNGIITSHHPDYDKPYDVVWLCSPCHWKEGRRIAK